MLFSRETFSDMLTFHRKNQKLSQGQFAEELALNHPMFEAVSQSILSKWESGKQEPPLLKRMCIANILGQSYNLNLDEKSQLKYAQSLELQHQKFQPIYDYQHNKVEYLPWTQVAKIDKQLIEKAHYNLTNELLKNTIEAFANLKLNVVKVSYDSVLLGHCLIGKNNNSDVIISMVFTSSEILKILFSEIELIIKQQLVIPAFTQSSNYFLKYMQYDLVKTKSILPFYTMPIEDIKNNKLFRYFVEVEDDSTLKSFALKE